MRARAAVTAVFALNGFLFGSLFARLPDLRDRAGLSHGELGLVLLCAMVGTFLMQPAAGALTARFGSRRLVMIGAAGYSLGMIVVAVAAPPAALGATFFGIGLAAGLCDVTMNVQGVAVEAERGRPVLSTMHAGFSYGVLAGALVATAAVAAGAGIADHFVPVGLLGLAVVVLARPHLLSDAPRGERGPAWARPTRKLAALGALAFCALLGEGALNDWLSVLFKDDFGATGSLAAASLAAFALAMATGRLAGDRITAALGPRRLALGGSLLAAAGVAFALAIGKPLPALFGVVAAGLGLAATFPVTLRAAAEQSDTPAPAIAAVSGIGYTAFLMGPPMIGGLAELFSLRDAMLLVVVVCLAAAVLSKSLSRT
jgi:MFS family permease